MLSLIHQKIQFPLVFMVFFMEGVWLMNSGQSLSFFFVGICKKKQKKNTYALSIMPYKKTRSQTKLVFHTQLVKYRVPALVRKMETGWKICDMLTTLV